MNPLSDFSQVCTVSVNDFPSFELYCVIVNSPVPAGNSPVDDLAAVHGGNFASDPDFVFHVASLSPRVPGRTGVVVVFLQVVGNR